MACEVILRAGTIALDTRNLREALHAISKAGDVRLHLTDEGTIAFGVDVSPLDRRAAAVGVTIRLGQLVLSTQDAWAPLAGWLGNQLARLLAAKARDPRVYVASLSNVLEILDEHETEVLAQPSPAVKHGEPAAQSPTGDEDVDAVLALVRLGRIELAEGAKQQLAELVRAHTKIEDLYEAMLDSPAVEDVFLSQSEFVAAFHATRNKG